MIVGDPSIDFAAHIIITDIVGKVVLEPLCLQINSIMYRIKTYSTMPSIYFQQTGILYNNYTEYLFAIIVECGVDNSQCG